ncbi:hypothetical protein ACU1JV_15170 [Paenibacillus sp. T2-29]|uniref:hypothetical protein n=1 Tax=Paenibacillus TaxID=44249 RepID=UPI0039BC3025
MNDLKQMTDQQLNDALRILLGWTKIGEHPDGHFGCWQTPEGRMLGNITGGKGMDYCNDPTASLEVQARALEVYPISYTKNLMWGRWRGELADYTQLDNEEWIKLSAIRSLLNASPRERAEAAYMTLSNRD